MDVTIKLINQRGLIKVEHGKYGSRAMMWLEPELGRVMGLTGGKAWPVETLVRPYQCVICSRHFAMPNISAVETKQMGLEWLVREQTQIEIGGVLLCQRCRPMHCKLRIDSYKLSGDFGERCSCTWDGTSFWQCVVCEAKDRMLESSRSVWESLRVIKPIGLFRDGIITRFSRHPYIGMREHERRAFLDSRFPILPGAEKERGDRALREREELVKEITRKDQDKDLTLADLESAKWHLTLWYEPLLKCFPEEDLKAGPRSRFAWIYVLRNQMWQVRSWRSLAIEIAEETGWIETPDYKKDYCGNQMRSHVTKEKRESKRKVKFVELEVEK
ncbi:hypothetical protein ABG768_025962 [Culter alburnus]|uniref:Uncharacterized protein n=1 Tax=Culter alburnus TaxID=194366 RepID=A0AAW2AI02_CULAL